MKAIRVAQHGGPEVLVLEEMPEPLPGPGQVVIDVRAIGVNPVDTYLRAGGYAPLPLPYTPGSDCAGVVRAVGDGVAELAKGDRVYTFKTIDGSYATLVLADAATVRQLPERVSFEQGAAIGVPAATAYRALFLRGGARAGETVLVHGGSGGVGLSAIQLARGFQLTVIASAGDAEGKQLVIEQGAHHAVDHGAPDQVMAVTGGRGVDLVVESLANANLGKDLQMLAPRGARVVIVGSRGPTEIDPRDTMRREADIRGVMLAMSTPKELNDIHSALAVALETGTLRPVIGKAFPLAEAARAHEEIMSTRARGKIVLVP